MRWRPGSIRTLSSLKYRNFRLLFLGTVLSHTGDFMQSMAQSWLVWELTRSAFMLGLVGFCQAVPRLFVSAIGGVIADRADRSKLLLLTQTLAMIQAFTFWFLVHFDLIEFWHILFLVLFLGCVNSLNQTTRQSLINNLVPRGELMNAVALNASVVNLSKIVGPSLGGVLISVIGIDGCFLANAVSFLAIIISIWMMELPPWERNKKERRFFHEVSEGFRYARSNRRVFAALFLTYIVALVGAPYSRFLPVFASDILHVGPTGFGLLTSAPGLGAVVSGLLLASRGEIRRRTVSLFLSVIAFSLFLILFALSRSMIVSLVCLTLLGSMHMVSRALANTTIQLETPPHLLGRTLSLFFMDKGLWSFGTLLIGGVAAAVGTPWALAMSGSVCAASTAALLYSRERPSAKDASHAEDHLSLSAESKPIIKS